MSFIFGKGGGVDLLKTFRNVNSRKLIKEIRECPVQNYDLVINDFEPVSAWACKFKRIPCVALSHQGAMRSSAVPKPKHSDWLGTLILKNYAPANAYYSFHFKKYDDNIFTPIIRADIRNKEITNEGHYTVYLPAYVDKKLIKTLSKIKNVEWRVFSKHTKEAFSDKNVHIEPINGEKFGASLASCAGVLCGAGFETPAEALFLGKKLLVIPMKHQVEQHYNAESLKEIGVTVLPKLSKKKIDELRLWVVNSKPVPIYFPNQTQFIIDKVLEEYITSSVPELNKAALSIPNTKD
jgi:uncharacterized protein (TIGR00661 family)